MGSCVGGCEAAAAGGVGGTHQPTQQGTADARASHPKGHSRDIEKTYFCIIFA